VAGSIAAILPLAPGAGMPSAFGDSRSVTAIAFCRLQNDTIGRWLKEQLV